MIREKVSEFLFKRLNRRLGKRLESGMSALHSGDKWLSGSFRITLRTDEITIYVMTKANGKQAEVYAETFDGQKSRDWSIPDNNLESGVDSAVGAVYDITYGDYA